VQNTGIKYKDGPEAQLSAHQRLDIKFYQVSSSFIIFHPFRFLRLTWGVEMFSLFISLLTMRAHFPTALLLQWHVV
jgi:NADH:ubiquinone oxidoreductase subunit 3 (subunit A)